MTTGEPNSRPLCTAASIRESLPVSDWPCALRVNICAAVFLSAVFPSFVRGVSAQTPVEAGDAFPAMRVPVATEARPWGAFALPADESRSPRRRPRHRRKHSAARKMGFPFALQSIRAKNRKNCKKTD